MEVRWESFSFPGSYKGRRFSFAPLASIHPLISTHDLIFRSNRLLLMEKTAQEQRHGDEWAHTIVCSRSDVPGGAS